MIAKVDPRSNDVVDDQRSSLMKEKMAEFVGHRKPASAQGVVEALGYTRERHSQRAARLAGGDPYGLLPGVHRVASLAKRWLLGTHQGSVGDPHLQAYLDEFVFRFNRRRSRSRGLVFYRVLELAVDHDPVRYRQLVADSRPKKVPPVPPRTRGHPSGTCQAL